MHICLPIAPVRKPPAASLPDQVPTTEKRKRLLEMEEVKAASRQLFLDDQLRYPQRVLWNRRAEQGWRQGITDNYIQVKGRTEVTEPNRMQTCMVSRDAGQFLLVG